MQRDSYNTVTEIPVLILCEDAERDGTANLAAPNASLRETLKALQPVRALRDGDPDKFWRALPEEDRTRLKALIGLRQSLETDDQLSVEKRERVYRTIMPELLEAMPGMPDSTRGDFHAGMGRLFAQRGKSLNVLERLLTHALRSARLILWREEKGQRLLPAIYCPDTATALYVRALIRIAGSRALLICPNCGNPFLQPRPNQDYCSIRCREAHRVARWRAAKAKGKKSPKRKR